jgi:hypothetical protein
VRKKEKGEKWRKGVEGETNEESKPRGEDFIRRDRLAL